MKSICEVQPLTLTLWVYTIHSLAILFDWTLSGIWGFLLPQFIILNKCFILMEVSLLPTNPAMIYKLALNTDFPWIYLC